ncbi:hypothetical protein [Spirosoma endophyticum]|uniref:Uncharacterized protein n=1 Tax=Spirosoma endophyticum TaxID=662367 RepID=A0A1I2E949_9BACT|nr:hypothetical protein [Spirosoma endophyticum]SFE89159.1 hypothetical protein SAMN05216167_12164 [Spirosoma endophyticum]
MSYVNTVIYRADDDRNDGPSDDRYFMRQSLQHGYPSVPIVEARDGAELLTLPGVGSMTPSP